MCYCLFLFFFFKQKTAYEMRISDWSSDVCSAGPSMIAPGSTDPSNPPTLGDIVRARATDCENRTAIEFEGRATSYAELRDGAFRIANALIASGLEPGDRVDRKSTRLNSSH